MNADEIMRLASGYAEWYAHAIKEWGDFGTRERKDELWKALAAAVRELERERDELLADNGRLFKRNAELQAEVKRLREVLLYLRSEFLHSAPNSYEGALFRAIEKALRGESYTGRNKDKL